MDGRNGQMDACTDYAKTSSGDNFMILFCLYLVKHNVFDIINTHTPISTHSIL